MASVDSTVGVSGAVLLHCNMSSGDLTSDVGLGNVPGYLD